MAFYIKRYLVVTSLFLYLGFPTSCNIPRDPAGSWEEVQRSGLTVGCVQNPPFVSNKSGPASGSEIKLIEEFAAKYHLDVKLDFDNESSLFKKLESHHVDMIIGGFDEKTIWKDKGGLSMPYDTAGHVIVVPRGENELLFHLEKYIIDSRNK